MRVSREKFAENREKILAVAGELFREKGFDGIGVPEVMKAAGLCPVSSRQPSLTNSIRQLASLLQR